MLKRFRHTVYQNALMMRNGGGGPAPDASAADILTFARSLATTYAAVDVTPTSGGLLGINSKIVGNYEYTTRKASTTISAFTASDWFTTTKDTTSSWIVVNGDLTINSGQTFTPPVRKLFTVVYVTGNLVLSGGISMTARGANHSGVAPDSGGATTAAAIQIGTGTFSGTANPQIPATGGAGGEGTSVDNGIVSGTAGSAGGSGGGGAGGKYIGTGSSGSGSAGTCFSGGSGGGGEYGTSSRAGDAGANGGRGGNALGSTVSAGGTGNPGGTGTDPTNGPNGNDGTGGTLIIIVAGTLAGAGTISANGVNGTRGPGAIGGGASGGGSVTVLYGTDTSTITPTATGGAGFACGSGGNGTARKLAIGAN